MSWPVFSLLAFTILIFVASFNNILPIGIILGAWFIGIVVFLAHQSNSSRSWTDRYSVAKTTSLANARNNKVKRNNKKRNRVNSNNDAMSEAVINVITIGMAASSVLFVYRDQIKFDLGRLVDEGKSLWALHFAHQTQSNPKNNPSQNRNKTKVSKARYDAAIEIKDRVSFYPDSRYNYLNTDDYKRAAGDLARIQYRMLKKRGVSKTYPRILIGDGSWKNDSCNETLPTLGLYQYSRGCNNLITINFSANGLVYEEQIEVLTTLAHEWGHHLIRLSGENISGINNELLSDCFAGIYLAYLDNYNAITESEIRSTIKMMSHIGNTHGTGIHGTPAQRRNGLMTGALYASNPNDLDNKNLWNAFCKGLDDVIDISVGFP